MKTNKLLLLFIPVLLCGSVSSCLPKEINGFKEYGTNFRYKQENYNQIDIVAKKNNTYVYYLSFNIFFQLSPTENVSFTYITNVFSANNNYLWTEHHVYNSREWEISSIPVKISFGKFNNEYYNHDGEYYKMTFNPKDWHTEWEVYYRHKDQVTIHYPNTNIYIPLWRDAYL